MVSNLILFISYILNELRSTTQTINSQGTDGHHQPTQRENDAFGQIHEKAWAKVEARHL